MADDQEPRPFFCRHGFALLPRSRARPRRTRDRGAPVPDVTVNDHQGKDVRLAEACAKGLALVFFHPKADTPGCTKQACSLRDANAELVAKGVAVFGVSFDKVEAQEKSAEKHTLPFPLLADPEGKVVKAFGVPATGSSAKRQAYLFKDGKLVWRDLAAATDKQAADVLEVVKPL